MRVRVDPILCELNALCVGLAPEVFDLTDDEELTVENSPGDEHWNDVNAAIYACPRRAITAEK